MAVVPRSKYSSPACYRAATARERFSPRTDSAGRRASGYHGGMTTYEEAKRAIQAVLVPQLIEMRGDLAAGGASDPAEARMIRLQAKLAAEQARSRAEVAQLRAEVKGLRARLQGLDERAAGQP